MLRALKAIIWVVALMPLGWLLWKASQQALGPDPGKAVVDELGLWALRLLLITLSMSPLRDITGNPIFIRLRRLLGLFCWFYASLHFLAASFYVIGWSWRELLIAFDERTYITLGLLAWSLLLPLGLTSNRRAQRSLGRRWRQLHRLIYPAALFACLHFIWLVRSDYWQPALYAGLFTVLICWRLPLMAGLRARIRFRAVPRPM